MSAGTGRLAGTLSPRAARVVFGTDADAAIDAELPYITTIDQAHIVMLDEQRLISTKAAAGLLGEIRALRADGFAALRGRAAPRGVYLLYESYLIDRLGADVGGVLHTGRSRNDLKATMHKLRMRAALDETLRGLVRLQALLLGRARAYRETVMPVYSQFQPSVPASYGWYLLGVAESLDRDIAGLVEAGSGLGECPLGAAGGAGTDVPIDPALTARLLGFAEPVEHAGYAIASRDTLLRTLSAAVLAGLTLSRLATDLQLWSMPELDMVDFPDSLVGSSSAMPQKRNPFLLEHLKGGASALAGAWTTAVGCMTSTPFGNSVEVTTEGVAPVWPALDQLHDMAQLSIAVVAGARPRPEHMLDHAHRGFTVATAVANRLVAQGVPFRVAHSVTGRLVTELIAGGASSFAAVAPEVLSDRLSAMLGTVTPGTVVRISAADVDPAAVAAATGSGGGPGPAPFAAAHTRLLHRWRERVDRLTAAARDLRAAEDGLTQAVEALLERA
ncbi:argininosuccinate lyase [Kitasatospora sp. NPDC057223]|uniref:argininosuccinate lyase n=1 Tax=Kitasatospora sp. NPDC057223 TaxID=3346055 RepID=UPI0036281B73